VFTVEERDRARDHVLALATADPRVVADRLVDLASSARRARHG
jgi:hypothetical protein